MSDRREMRVSKIDWGFAPPLAPRALHAAGSFFERHFVACAIVFLVSAFMAGFMTGATL